MNWEKHVKHIQDCWDAIDELLTNPETTPGDLEELFEDFPRWSGDWYWEREGEDEIRVVNIIFDSNHDLEDEDYVTYYVEDKFIQAMNNEEDEE